MHDLISFAVSKSADARDDESQQRSLSRRPELQASAELEPQAEVSLVRELEPEFAAELELEPAAEQQIVLPSAAATGAELPQRAPAAMLDALECGICCEHYGSYLLTPRILPCGHTFCEGCLTGVATQSETEDAADGHQTMACPSCSVLMEVPKEGMGELMKNYVVESMLDAVA